MPNNENNNFNQSNEIGANDLNQNLQSNPEPINNNFSYPTPELPRTVEQPIQQPALEVQQVNSNEQSMEPVSITPENSLSPTTEPDTNGFPKSFFPFCLINALLIYGALYLVVNKNEIFSIGGLAYIIVLSVFFAIKDKKDSSFHISLMVGGMLSAIVCFIFSMTTEDMDLWTYYTIASAVVGFLGLIFSSIIKKFITDIKNIKALQTIFYLLFIAAIIGGPFLAYKKYPTEFHRIVFYQRTEVVASTYEEFVLQTLKGRYDISFTCDFNNKQHYKTERNELMVKMICSDENNNKINVRTIAYNEGSNQYTLIDDFIDVIYLKDIKAQFAQKIRTITGASEVLFYLFPKEKCTFIGDCVDCDEYYKGYEKENNPDNRYRVSSTLDLSKYINLSDEEFIKKFINTNNYKVIIHIRGKFDKNSYDFEQSDLKILEELNNSSVMNNFGYEIKYTNYEKDQYELKLHEKKGTTTVTKKFE